MSVSWRHMLAGAGVAVLAAGGLTAMGQQAPGGCCAPPHSPPPPPPSHGCCQTPKNLIVNVPGVSVAAANVSVGASSTVIAAAGVSTTLSSGVVVSGGSGGGFAFGGGGGFYSNPGVPQGSITGLNVYAEDLCIDRIIEEIQVRPVQALCIDDTNTPHPASRVDDAAAVDSGFEGEIYRCIAGTHMQVTLGHMVDGKPSFDAGETVSCVKGESLWHSKGGVLACRTQTPERNCNERSLLRKFGPGVKLIQIATKKNYCEPVQKSAGKVSGATRVPRAIPAGDLVLDGGVGQGF